MGIDKAVYKYNISNLSTFTGKSKQSLYKLIKQNDAFFASHRQKEQQNVYFDEEAKAWFLKHYGIEEDASKTDAREEKNQGSTSSKDYLQKIQALEEQVADLKERLRLAEEDHRELMKQHSLALLALQQEKQEKLMLLPAPKKTITERIKGLFVSNKKE